MSLEIKIDLAGASREEILTVITTLQTWDRMQLMKIPAEPVEQPSHPQLFNFDSPEGGAAPATMTGDTPVMETARPEPTPAEAPKPKRGRTSKADKEKAETLVQEALVQEVASQHPDPSSSSEPTVSSSAELKTVPLDELRAALKAYVKAKGGDLTEGTKLLNEFGVERVSELADLPADKHHAFLAKVEAANA